MENTFFIYLLTRLTAIKSLFIGGCVVFGIFTLGFFAVYLFEESEGGTNPFRPAKNISIIGLIISAVFAALIPKTGEAFFIWCGGKTIDYVENNELLKALPDKTIESAYNYLDALNEEIKERRDTTVKK
jgi:hypothetical protein